MHEQEQTTWETAEKPASKPVWVLLAMLSAALLLYLLMRSDQSQLGEKHPAVGTKLTTLEIEPLTGDPPAVRLADLEGHVTLLNFWGTWCEPCQMEMPQLVKLVQQLSDKPQFRALLVSCGTEDDPVIDPLRTDTQIFLEAAKYNVPTYGDPNAITRRALEPRMPDGVSYPTTLIMDRHGVIRGVWQGYSPYAVDEMRTLIEQLLAKDVDRDSTSKAPGGTNDRAKRGP